MQNSEQDQDHRLALVTGATGAIGKAIALEIGQLETGKYFEHMQMRRCQFGEDSEKVEALYQACLTY